jgi:hypothetical protein
MLIFIVTAMRMSYLKMCSVLRQVLGSVVGISVSHVFLEEDDSCKYILQSYMLRKYEQMLQNENISSARMASDSVLNTL